jgi:hypothetical protein
LEVLGKCRGYCGAKQCCMGFVLGTAELNQVERLVSELQAIEHWDAGDWRKCVPKRYEILAFVARRERRTEILSQLLTLIPRLAIKKQEHPWIVRKSSTRKKQKQRRHPRRE